MTSLYFHRLQLKTQCLLDNTEVVGDPGIEPDVRLREGVTVPCHTLRPVAHLKLRRSPLLGNGYDLENRTSTRKLTLIAISRNNSLSDLEMILSQIDLEMLFSQPSHFVPDGAQSKPSRLKSP